jgi:pimeloyl-ACP methyl ester carboxylesterase
MSRIKALWNSPGRWIILLVLAIMVLMIVTVVNFILRFRDAATPTMPGAFYTPPEPLPSGEPGTIIRSEPLPDMLPDGASAWRILYLSTDLNGEPIAVSGTVVAPSAESASPRPVIAWAHGTIGILPQCGVSHTSNPYQQTPMVDLMVRQGFVVVATDYPGLGTPGIHPYIVGPVAAYAVLDSVRAAQQLDVNAGDEFVVWGASQGGHSSLWTAQLAAEYAPDLTLIAAAASAPAIDLRGIIEARSDSKSGGVLFSEFLYAWSHVYPGANLDDIIKPEHRAQFEKMATTCVSTPAAFLTIGDLLTPNDYLSADLLTTEPWRTLIDDNTPRGEITVPLLITHGTADDLIPFEGSQAEALRRCDLGEDVTFIRLPGVGHDAREESAIFTIGWIEDRFAGRPTGSTCAS